MRNNDGNEGTFRWLAPKAWKSNLTDTGEKIAISTGTAIGMVIAAISATTIIRTMGYEIGDGSIGSLTKAMLWLTLLGLVMEMLIMPFLMAMARIDHRRGTTGGPLAWGAVGASLASLLGLICYATGISDTNIIPLFSGMGFIGSFCAWMMRDHANSIVPSDNQNGRT